MIRPFLPLGKSPPGAVINIEGKAFSFSAPDFLRSIGAKKAARPEERPILVGGPIRLGQTS